MNKVYYISQAPHLDNIQAVCAAGIRIVQLRMKTESASDQKAIATAALAICQTYNAKLIINDNVGLAQAIGAHGVHLGKEDLSPTDARKILGPNAIIGGTANTLSDCEWLWTQGVDYIGLGPFQFTTTKKKLSPSLGLAGYREILEALDQKKITIPIYAIGGITEIEMLQLAKTPIYGVAISGYLSQKPVVEIQQFLDTAQIFKS